MILDVLPMFLFAMIIFSVFVFSIYYLPFLAKSSKKTYEQNQKIIELLEEIKTEKKQ